MSGPNTLSAAEIDEYSLQHHLQTQLDAAGWNVPVTLAQDGWPVNEEIVLTDETRARVYVLVAQGRLASYELGSHAKRRDAYIHIYADSDPIRVRLAEEITNLIRDVVPIYAFVTGNEANPSVAAYFATDSVLWRRIPALITAPTSEKFRAVVETTLRRVDA